jgi:hypothetical protein
VGDSAESLLLRGATIAYLVSMLAGGRLRGVPLLSILSRLCGIMLAEVKQVSDSAESRCSEPGEEGMEGDRASCSHAESCPAPTEHRKVDGDAGPLEDARVTTDIVITDIR